LTAPSRAVHSSDDDAHWYATANFGANFMSDQSVRLSGDGPTQSGDGSLPPGNFASTSLALNGLYSFNLFGREEIRTYVGLGVAWLTEVDIDFEQGGQELSDSGDGVGVQLLAGARCEIGERWFLDAGPRYLSAGEVTMDGEGAATGRVRADYEPWSATLGAGWRF
jgi:opacity protein-like surface antigen